MLHNTAVGLGLSLGVLFVIFVIGLLPMYRFPKCPGCRNRGYLRSHTVKVGTRTKTEVTRCHKCGFVLEVQDVSRS